MRDLTPEIAQGVCVRTASAAVLDGSIASARQSVRRRAAREELQHRRHPRRRAGAGGAERRGAERAQSDCDPVPNASRRIARHHRETLDAAREATTPSLEALKAYSAAHERHVGCGTAPAALRACGRDRSRFCDGPCAARVPLRAIGESRRSRGRACSRPTSCAIAPATPSASTSKPCTTATSPAISNGSDGRWKRGPKATRAIHRPRALLAGFALTSTGQHELAIAETEKAIALDPDPTPAYGSKAFNQLHLNRLDDALLTIASRDGAQAGIGTIFPGSAISSPS